MNIPFNHCKERYTSRRRGHDHMCRHSPKHEGRCRCICGLKFGSASTPDVEKVLRMLRARNGG